MAEKASSSVLVLKAFTPDSSSARGPELEYTPNLETETGKIIDEPARQRSIRESQQAGDLLEKAKNETELSKSYLVYIAFRMMESDTPQTRQLWADEFTKKSIDLYGAPDKHLGTDLALSQAQTLLSADADGELADKYKASARQAGLNLESLESPIDIDAALGFEHSRRSVGTYLNDTYRDVYAAMNIDTHSGPFTPADIADTFEVGLKKLSEKDSAWKDWTINRNEGKDSLSVVGTSETVIVGMKRAEASAEQVAGLFAHEVLRHALTAVNGSKLDKSLKTGLPGYLDFEEGAGVFNEYAITGKLKDELVDRYVDITLALGVGADNQRVPRSAMLEFAFAREELRNEQRAPQEKLSDENLKKKVYAHINRIYRGTPGNNEVIGVFTKDIAYLEGFLKVGAYLETALADGKTIDEIMRYIAQGKFDPTNEQHADYVAATKQPKPLKEVELFYSA